MRGVVLAGRLTVAIIISGFLALGSCHTAMVRLRLRLEECATATIDFFARNLVVFVARNGVGLVARLEWATSRAERIEHDFLDQAFHVVSVTCQNTHKGSAFQGLIRITLPAYP